jgi:hypothetical protein
MPSLADMTPKEAELRLNGFDITIKLIDWLKGVRRQYPESKVVDEVLEILYRPDSRTYLFRTTWEDTNLSESEMDAVMADFECETQRELVQHLLRITDPAIKATRNSAIETWRDDAMKDGW